jgi:RNA polymerase sigma factor (sigma-70 family)
MPPPPADSLASRLFVAPALRTQPDRRLVSLVREGYELAFEEIVRRYRGPLERFAAAIVGSRSEDVTQDAFSKALLALRGSEAEIELRPWLYRIVRNTALNDIRDSPPPTEELGEGVTGGPSAAVEAERREEMSELTERLRALPETQRAAIVMRELEGLSHEEIAAALGVSGGAARQAIHRARSTLRDGVGLLLPLPLLRLLLDHGSEAAAAGAATATGGSMALGGLGAGGAAKIGVAAILVAGSVGAGVAVEQHDRGGDGSTRPAAASAPLGAEVGSSGPGGEGSNFESGSGNSGSESQDDAGRRHGGDGGSGSGDGRGGPGSGGSGADDSSGAGGGLGSGNDSGSGGGSGSRSRGDSGSDDGGLGHGSGRSGHDSESSGSGRGSGHGSGSDSGSGSSGSGSDSGDDSGSGRSGSSGSGSSGGSGSAPGGPGSSDDSLSGESATPVDPGSGGNDSPDDSGSAGSGGGSGSSHPEDPLDDS